MESNRTSNSVKNMIFGMVYRCIQLLIPFFIRTISIQKLGAEFLGLNSLFTSIIQVLNLAELGIGNALVYSMYRPVAEHNTQRINELLGLYKKIYSLIGWLILIIGLILMPFLPYIISMEEIDGTGINIYFLFIFYLVNTVITYWLFAYKKSILIAYQKHRVISICDSACHLLMYAVQIVGLFLAPNYLLYIIVMPLFTIVNNVMIACITQKRYPELNAESVVKLSEYKDIFDKVKYLVGHKVGAVIINSADSIVVSAFLSVHILTTYSNYFYVITALTGCINVGYNAILASVGNSIITESKEKLLQLFYELSFIIFYIVSFSTTCLFCLVQPFMQWWMGENFMFDMVNVILLVVYFYTWQIRVIGLNFKDAAGMWKNDALKPYVGMVVNICLNIILVQIMGVGGVLVATIIVMVGIYFPWETKVLFRDIFKTSSRTYVMKEFKYAIITIIVTCLTYFSVQWISNNHILLFVAKIIIVAVETNALLILFCFRMPEFIVLVKRGKYVWNKLWKKCK